MMLSLYRTATILGAPLILFYLNQRKAQGKEDPARFNERLGMVAAERPSGALIWLHAASVGESLSMLPLIEKLLKDRPSCHLMMTTGTVTSAKLMLERLPERAFHQYIPVDRPAYVRRFLKHWQPDIALWAESEFWPNIITETKARNIPMVLVNGRISPKSFAGWQRARGLIKTLLQCFTLCLGQSDNDVERLKILGSTNSKNLGNLKFAVPALPTDEQTLAALKITIGNRPLWLAASTHPGEEEIIARVHHKLKTNHPGLLTVIVPRHPSRGEDILGSLQIMGMACALRSDGDPVRDDTDIYIANTMGELGLFFRLTDIAFMGKSLVPLGGQNPLEALRLDCAVLHGPHMMNFQWMSEQMIERGCSLQVDGEEELAASVSQLLSEPSRREGMIHHGRAFVDSQAQVVELVADEIETILDAKISQTNLSADDAAS
jgi:3-deoxy-D-manno-octulosonic-acid transferase